MGSNVTYSFSADGNICYGRLANGKQFIIDSDMYPLIENIKFYLVYGDRVDRVPYISDAKGNLLHTYIMPKIKGMEIDHVNMDIRPYDDEINGKPFRSAYLQSIEVVQNIDRFAARYAEEEFPRE